MKIGIDLDCVLNNLIEEWIKTYNDKYDDNLALEKVTEWDLTKLVKEECGNKIYELLNHDLLSKLKPLDGAVEVTERLSKHHEIYIVTATHFANAGVKVEWIKKYFPHIDPKNIIICHKKNLIDVDVLIDDGAHNITDFPRRTIVYDYAYNRNLPEDYVRVGSWDEIEDVINGV